MHRLCAVVFVLSSFCSVQAQDVSLEALYLDDCVGKIMEPSTVSAQSLTTDPRVEEPSGASDEMTVTTEVVQPGDEAQVAERAPRGESNLTGEATEPSIMQDLATEPPVEEVSQSTRVGVISTDQERDVPVEAVQPEIQTSEQSTNSIPTHIAIPSAAVTPIGPSESTNTEPSKEELTRIIERILDDAMQRGDECLVASIDGAENIWNGENVGAGAGKLTDIVERSSPAQIVPNESTGKQAEGEFLNSFSQDLE